MTDSQEETSTLTNSTENNSTMKDANANNHSKEHGRTIMIQGTASDVGKSVVTTALCRIFKQDGYQVAPFKSQNMALNSYVTPDGKEIGRAQGVQAEACGIAATTDMNPVLLKPMQDMQAQVVVHGKPFRNLAARDYRSEFLPFARATVTDAVQRLKAAYDIVVMEGAGSPAEINLKHNDIVNMNMAKWADAPVILVADIDRGGVFATIVGTLELLEPEERDRVKGFIINKFRGDVGLLRPGLDWLEQRTGKPVLGVLPYAEHLDIEAEDSVALEAWKGRVGPARDLDIAVIALPHISNFTDVDPLIAEADVRVRYVRHAAELDQPDVILLPGTKSTIADMEWLQGSGLADAILDYACTSWKEGRDIRIVGICGGYQILGTKIEDRDAAESEGQAEVRGLSLLPVETTFTSEKRTVRVQGTVMAGHGLWGTLQGMQVDGYEIHMGRTRIRSSSTLTPLLTDIAGSLSEGGFSDGAVSADGRILGTYLHGIFHHDEFRRTWLNTLRETRGLPAKPIELRFQNRKEEAFDRLADLTRQHLDMKRIYEIMGLQEG